MFRNFAQKFESNSLSGSYTYRGKCSESVAVLLRQTGRKGVSGSEIWAIWRAGLYNPTLSVVDAGCPEFVSRVSAARFTDTFLAASAASRWNLSLCPNSARVQIVRCLSLVLCRVSLFFFFLPFLNFYINLFFFLSFCVVFHSSRCFLFL